MIIEIPEPADFAQTSVNLLNLAWEIAVEALDDYQQSFVIHPQDTPLETVRGPDGTLHTYGGPDTTFTPEERQEAKQEYWRRLQPELGNALSLVQQGVEIGLKGRIAGVSPFLLIIKDARDYPRGSATRDVPFSEFRSIDAADLLRVHDTVCEARLGPAFATFWEDLRRERNQFMHGVVSESSGIRATDLIEKILIAARDLHPLKRWFGWRLSYVQNDAFIAAFAIDGDRRYADVLHEYRIVFSALAPVILREHFGLARRGRLYYCVKCMDQCDGNQWSDSDLGCNAQLQPNTPAATTLRCTACGETYPVIRAKCVEPSCRGTVHGSDRLGHLICLTCQENQTIPRET